MIAFSLSTGRQALRSLVSPRCMIPLLPDTGLQQAALKERRRSSEKKKGDVGFGHLQRGIHRSALFLALIASERILKFCRNASIYGAAYSEVAFHQDSGNLFWFLE